MKLIGFYTGNIYNVIEISKIKECCVALNSKNPVFSDKKLLDSRRKELKSRCEGCHNCDESLNDSVNKPFNGVI